MLSHIVRHIFGMARRTNFKLGLRMEDDRISHRRHDLQGQRSRSQSHVIRLNRVVPIVHKSKTNSRSSLSLKLTEVYHMTLRTSFKVTGRLTQTHKMCHIFRTVRPKNFKVGVRMENVDPSATSAIIAKVKGQCYKFTSSVRLISASS